MLFIKCKFTELIWNFEVDFNKKCSVYFRLQEELHYKGTGFSIYNNDILETCSSKEEISVVAVITRMSQLLLNQYGILVCPVTEDAMNNHLLPVMRRISFNSSYFLVLFLVIISDQGELKFFFKEKNSFYVLPNFKQKDTCPISEFFSKASKKDSSY